jgi:hypothetical protein
MKMKNPFEYWAGRKGLQMWAVLDESVVEVQFPFNTEQAERLQSRRDYVGCIHHLTRNDGCYMVTVVKEGIELNEERDTLYEAIECAKVLGAPLKMAV